MCHSRRHGLSVSRRRAISRRDFVRGCGAVLATAGSLTAAASLADEFLGGSGVFLLGHTRLCRLGRV
jgi:hypothetical protein